MINKQFGTSVRKLSSSLDFWSVRMGKFSQRHLQAQTLLRAWILNRQIKFSQLGLMLTCMEEQVSVCQKRGRSTYHHNAKPLFSLLFLQIALAAVHFFSARVAMVLLQLCLWILLYLFKSVLIGHRKQYGNFYWMPGVFKLCVSNSLFNRVRLRPVYSVYIFYVVVLSS